MSSLENFLNHFLTVVDDFAKKFDSMGGACQYYMNA